jgi:hypothetical protein
MTFPKRVHKVALRFGACSSVVALGFFALSLANPGCAATVTAASCSPDPAVTMSCQSSNQGDFGYTCNASDVTPPNSAGTCYPVGDVTWCCMFGSDASIEDDEAGEATTPSEGGGVEAATCDPICTDGCCDSTGACVAGTEDTACGTGGADCKDCTTSTETCNAGTCL